jgi:cyanophycin synthetase
VKLYFKIYSKLKYWRTSVDVTDMMHPENIFLAERISRVIGFDVWVDNGRKFDTTIKGKRWCYSEVNAAPGFRMHLALQGCQEM